MRRALSVLLLFMGGLLIYWGYDLQRQLDTELIRQVTGEGPEAVWQYYITGCVALIFGGYGVWKYRG